MGQISVEHDLNGIKGLHMITPKKFGDERGYFMEVFNQADLRDAGIDTAFVQDNQSLSVKGVLRGMHYQIRHPQAKLIRAIKGAIFDAVIDLRTDSPTFGRWHGAVLSEENCRQLFIPEGFAHGFMVLSDVAEVCYKCSDFYHPDDEGGILWSDPDVGVEWPEPEDGAELIISERDKSLPRFSEVMKERNQK